MEMEHGERNYFSVTEEDIQASLGDSFDNCFGKALGYEQERSFSSETLLDLFAAEVTSRVNQALDEARQSMKSTETERDNPFYIEDMVFYIIHILRECYGDRDSSPVEKMGITNLLKEADELLQFLEDKDQDSSPVEKMGITNIVKEADELLQFLEDIDHPPCENVESSVNAGKEQPLESARQEEEDEDEASRSSSQISDVSSCDSVELPLSVAKEGPHESVGKGKGEEEEAIRAVSAISDVSPCEMLEPHFSCAKEDKLARKRREKEEREKSFLVGFTKKLVEHISYSTNRILDVDLNGMLDRLRERTVGSVVLPRTVGNIHIPVFIELSREFKSTQALLAALESRDGVFEDVVVRALKAQLGKSLGINVSFLTNLKRTFCKKNKVTPVCDIEDVKLVIESTPPPQKTKKCPSIKKMFSALTGILRKTFK